ncbi:endoribonuclease LACTB2-like isoform X1 [Portunus trituberculatus]|nr:endoribonuclease LACTB2-like isoform X1 [Portunus trituberculatus]
MTTFISKVTTIRPGIIRILGCNPGPMTLQGTNTYLIGTGTKRVLLDVGEARNAEYITSLESVLQQQNTTINQIVISHWHHDHIGGLKDVLKCLPEPVSVYKIPRFDKDDDPMLNLTTYIPLKHLDEIKTQEATLRVINSVKDVQYTASLRETWIPRGLEEARVTKRKLYGIANFPNVIGIIDGTHIPIAAPPVDEELYINRKNFHSLNIKVVCNADYIFQDYCCRFPGSTYD